MKGRYSKGTMNRAEYDSELQFVLRNIDEKLARLSKKLAIVKHVLALYRYMVDPEVHWTKKVLVVVALVYFIMPADAIPDFTPIIGYVDDAAVIAAVIKTLGKGFLKYYGEGIAVGQTFS
jgi:uncharacterized membrane protein YkvA (DUF1232 family)